MRRLIAILVLLIIAVGGGYWLNYQWMHRYDDLIARQAKIYRQEDALVWSLIYEETYFRPSIIGADQEVGLMQVTPTVAREWAKETGLREMEKAVAENRVAFLSDPERNIQVGCWYLEKLGEKYRGLPAAESMILAAYNAGPSRVEEWTKEVDENNLSEKDFIERIAIPSTKSYVTSILQRHRGASPTKQSH